MQCELKNVILSQLNAFNASIMTLLIKIFEMVWKYFTQKLVYLMKVISKCKSNIHELKSFHCNSIDRIKNGYKFFYQSLQTIAVVLWIKFPILCSLLTQSTSTHWSKYGFHSWIFCYPVRMAILKSMWFCGNFTVGTSIFFILSLV